MTRQQRIGIYIIATFGFVYVMANAGDLPSPLASGARAAALIAAIGAVVASRMTTARGEGGARFDRRYWLIVAGEIVVGLAGLFVINAVLGAHAGSLGWISLIVGIHFFGLYAIWRLPVMIWLGAVIALSGAAGLVAAAAGLPMPLVASIAGLVPGAALLAAAWWSVVKRAGADRSAASWQHRGS